VVYRATGHHPTRVDALAIEALHYLLTGRGLFASNVCDVGAILRSGPSHTIPDLRIAFRWRVLPERRLPLVDFEVALLQPSSRGRLMLATRNPADAPLIDPGYLYDPSDLERVLRGIAVARAIADSRACRATGVADELLPGTDGGHESLAAHVRDRADTAFHWVGTCRIGDDPLAVVDSQLRVRGLDGLRVADASVMPSAVAGNANAAVIAIAERAAELIRTRA
jgi:choline dehydrogenase